MNLKELQAIEEDSFFGLFKTYSDFYESKVINKSTEVDEYFLPIN